MPRRPAPPRTIMRDGTFWFALPYAAKLLSIAPRKVEMLVIAGRLSAREEDGVRWIAEGDVTGLRRDPVALAAAKASVREDLTALKRATPDKIEGYHARGPDQDVLPIADYRHKMPGRDC